LIDIACKIEDGERLTFEDGLALYRTEDLNALGKLADTVRRKKHGRTTYFNVNRHFNHTNICVADCKFCGFYKRARQEGAYTHSINEGIEIARTAVAEGATELHIVGGLNSKLPFEYYTDLFSSLKREFPKLHLKALTMVELDFMARFYKMSDEDVIEKLHAAGMDSCPGAGAEIFAEPTRSRICDHKCDGDRWLELAEDGLFDSVAQARSETFSYIDGYYNRIRRHSSLGYKSPEQFEKWFEFENLQNLTQKEISQ
jgi:aminodeoxyfutalosine synthase